MRILLSLLLLSFFSFAQAQEKPEGLFINSKAPDFKAKDQDGNDVVLKDLRKKGNIVLVFYRGSWCPHCSRYLKQLQHSFEDFKAKGAQVIIVTPQGDEGIDSAVARSGASFPVVHDKDMKIANNYKVAYKVDERTFGRYKNAGIDLLKENNQVKDAWLAVPAVYIINTEGSITFRYFEEDYKKRVPVADILKALSGDK